MNIKDILAKLAKGEELTDAEKAFLKTYDPDKEKNDAAAAARRKAEEEAAALKAENAELKKKADEAKKAEDEAKKSQMTADQKRDAEFAELKAKIEGLEKAKTDAEQKAAAVQRSQTIRDAAKAAGIALAPKTVSETLFYQMLEATLSGIDITNQEALTAALDKFKTENPGIIIAPGNGSGVNPGDPANSDKSGKNPWAKDTFNLSEQVTLLEKDPDKARALAAEAGVKLE